MKMPLISVIVPVYRVESYLSECVESLLKQTYPSFEIILVDDGSPDNCPAICDDYAARYDNIRTVHQENRGLSGARNTGMSLAKGTLFSFVDSDDSVAPEMLSRLYELMQAHDAEITTSGFSAEGSFSGVLNSEQAITCILKENTNLSTSAWGKLYRAELFADISYPEGLLFEDYATAPLLFDKAQTIVHTGEVLYHYRTDNNEGITRSAFSPRRMEYFTVSDGVEAFLRERYPALPKYARNRRTRHAISFFSQLAKTGERDREIEKTLARYTRRGILPYWFSSYKLTSKGFGTLIALCPAAARKLFAR